METVKDWKTNANGKMMFLDNLKPYLPSIIAIFVLLFAGQILSPGFFSVNNICNIITISSVLMMVVIGQGIVTIAGNCGIDLSVGPLVSMGALIGPALTGGQSGKLILAILVLVLLGSCVGTINGFGIQYLKIPALAMTLITSTAIDGFTLLYTRGQPSVTIPPLLLAVNHPIWGSIRVMILIAVIAIAAVEWALRKTNLGHSFYLIGSNRAAASLCGLRVDWIAILAYILSGVFACMAGLLLVGYSGSGQLKMGSDYTMLSVAAVVIGGIKVSGGRGSVAGGALGAIVLTLLTSVLVAVGLQVGVRQFFQGLILLLILLINCRGQKIRG